MKYKIVQSAEEPNVVKSRINQKRQFKSFTSENEIACYFSTVSPFFSALISSKTAKTAHIVEKIQT